MRSLFESSLTLRVRLKMGSALCAYTGPAYMFSAKDLYDYAAAAALLPETWRHHCDDS